MSALIPKRIYKLAELNAEFDSLIVKFALNEITFDEYKKRMTTYRRKVGQFNRRYK
jgi:hypothetical protein